MIDSHSTVWIARRSGGVVARAAPPRRTKNARLFIGVRVLLLRPLRSSAERIRHSVYSRGATGFGPSYGAYEALSDCEAAVAQRCGTGRTGGGGGCPLLMATRRPFDFFGDEAILEVGRSARRRSARRALLQVRVPPARPGLLLPPGTFLLVDGSLDSGAVPRGLLHQPGCRAGSVLVVRRFLGEPTCPLGGSWPGRSAPRPHARPGGRSVEPLRAGVALCSSPWHWRRPAVGSPAAAGAAHGIGLVRRPDPRGRRRDARAAFTAAAVAAALTISRNRRQSPAKHGGAAIHLHS